MLSAVGPRCFPSRLESSRPGPRVRFRRCAAPRRAAALAPVVSLIRSWLDFGFGMDFGYSNDPTTLVKVAVDNKNNKIHLKELVCEPYLKTNDICLILQKECGKDCD